MTVAAYNPTLVPAVRSASNNPIIPGLGICDPHIHIFQDRAYLYASHDRSPNNQTWLMDDWQVWSSHNLIEWMYETTILPETTYLGRCETCWAVDAAERGGKYYVYFSNGTKETGVAVSDSPAGEFRDPLGRPLLAKDLTDSHQYDPTVFVDDDADRTPYLIWGCRYHGNGYYIARLNEDMVSLAESPRSVAVDGGLKDDKSFLHKYGDRYYLSWASHYAISKNVYGPYTYCGNLGASVDHGSFFEWNNQWFFAFGMFNTTEYYRDSGICYIHYLDNGQMIADPTSVEFGVGRYDARWNRIEAANYHVAHSVTKKGNPHFGVDVAGITNRSHLHYPNIDHLTGNCWMSVYAICNDATDVVVEVRQGGTEGLLLGECPLESANTWEAYGYHQRSFRLTNAAGRVDLSLTFRGNGSELLRLKWFRFHTQCGLEAPIHDSVP